MANILENPKDSNLTAYEAWQRERYGNIVPELTEHIELEYEDVPLKKMEFDDFSSMNLRMDGYA